MVEPTSWHSGMPPTAVSELSDTYGVGPRKVSSTLLEGHRTSGSNAIEGNSIRKTGWRFVMLAATAGFMFGNFYFFDQTSATEDAIRKQTGMTENEFGFLSSVYSWPNVILPLFGGMAIDIFGVRIAALVFTCLVTLGSLLFTLGLSMESTTMLIVARVVFGLGGESQNVSSLAFITKWFRGKELAFAVAIDIAVSRLGSVATFDTQGVLAKQWDVTSASAVGSAVCLLSLVSGVFCVWVDWWGDRKDRTRGLIVDAATADEEFHLRDITQFGKFYWLVTISCVTTYVAAFPFMQVISAPYLLERFDFDEQAADSIVSNINLTSAFLAPVLGLIVDRFGRRPLLLVFSSSAFVIALSGFMIYPKCHHCESVLGLYILMGVALSVYGSVIWPIVPLCVDKSVVGTAFGLMTALQNMGMAISPMVLTYLHQNSGSFTSSFVYILGCVCVGLAAGITIWILDRKGDGRLMRGSGPAPMAETSAELGS